MVAGQQRYTKEVNNLSGREYLNFTNSLRSPATKKSYAYSMALYLKFLNLGEPSQLMFSNDIKTIETHLIDYMVELKSRIAYSTRVSYVSAIITFYAMNDIILNKKKLYRYLGEPARVHRDRAYTTEEIHKLLEGIDLRLRSITLTLASSGCRLGALPSLKISNLIPIESFHMYQLTIYENTKDEYYTFCTPEARHAIDEYLQYRERSGERITKHSPLFREQFDRNDQFMVARPRPINTGGLQTTMTNALIKAGLRDVMVETEAMKIRGRIRKDVARFNGFRKFFNTNLVHAKANPAVKEMLMGHSIQLDDNYYRPSQDELLQEYLKAVDLLTINEENRLKRQVEQLTIEKSKIDEFRDELEKLKGALNL